jgi:NADH-quinone oxidoreductase subunit C
MRDAERNAQPKVEDAKGHQVLKFYFTPADEPLHDPENPQGDRNPHAKRTTHVPEVVQALRDQFEDVVLRVETYAGEDTIFVEKDRIVDVCRFLRELEGFNYLADLGGIDRFTDEGRFEVYYNLVSLEGGKRVRLKVRVDEEDLHVPSVTGVFRSAGWNEREAYDMLGLVFDGHPDMRRMYMPEDFEYHPLRKEFPLLGVPGSLPLPPQTPEGELTLDPFAAAHGSKPVKSYEEPRSTYEDEGE